MKKYIKPNLKELALEKTIMSDGFIHQSIGDQHQLSKERGIDEDDAEAEEETEGAFGRPQMTLWD